jgi:hypothetical protein
VRGQVAENLSLPVGKRVDHHDRLLETEDVLTPHTLENVGEHQLRNITVELKHLT